MGETSVGSGEMGEMGDVKNAEGGSPGKANDRAMVMANVPMPPRMTCRVLAARSPCQAIRMPSFRLSIITSCLILLADVAAIIADYHRCR